MSVSPALSIILLLLSASQAPAMPMASPSPALQQPSVSPSAIAPRPGDIEVWLQFTHDSPALRLALAALGYREIGEIRVMVAAPGGGRRCLEVYKGYLPRASVEAARKLPGLKTVGVSNESP